MRKRKDNGLVAILCLAVATVAIGGASIALSRMETPVNQEQPGGQQEQPGGQQGESDKKGTELTVIGDTKVQSAVLNEDGTFTLVIKEEGYVGEMVIEATYSADGKTLLSFDVLSHTETDGLGSKVDEDAYKAVLANVKLPIAANGMDISAILGSAAEEVLPGEEGGAEEVTLKDGVYRAQATPDDKGNYAFVTLTVEGGKVVAATWDEVYNGSLKSVLSTTGKYVMKPVWHTQAERVCQYVVDNQSTAGIMNEKGYTDVVSGVSINVAGAVGLLDQAIGQANGKDGVYEVKADADDKGNYAFVSVTVEGGKITAATWDEVYSGSLKSTLSKEGKYVMKPVWQTQSESVCQYVVDNQTTAGIANEKGYTDVVSGVSINVAGAVGLLEDCMQQANSGNGLKDGVYEVKAAADEKGNYAFVTVTIEGGKITSVTWDEVYNGSLKSVLSTTGKYVMKPVWHTQAERVCQYVVDNQSTAGIMNEKGYTDVVSGVSINVAGAVGLLDQAIAQANGKDGVYEVKANADDKGNYAFVSVTVEGGKITAATWDEVYNGSLKSTLSKEGKYVMKPVWQTQSESVCQYVVDHQTTAGIANEKGYTDVVSGVSINVAGALNLIDQAIAKASNTLKDGVYEVKATPDEKGNYAFVTVTIEGGKITSVTWDEAYNGSLKSVLSTTGKYVMKPIWNTQAERVCQYVVDNQGTAGIMNEKGYTDVVSGVSINIAGAVGLLDQAITQANGKDGVYEAKGTADDKGNYAFVSVTVEGGKITAATWDEVYNGSLKSTLSKEGKYVMKPVWQTQSESVCKYVVDNQTTEGIANEKGYTDVVSGVSINVAGALKLIDQALTQAGRTVELQDGVYQTKATADEKGNYAFVTIVVAGGKIISVEWDEVYNGSLKSVLSTTGKYVMTADGPVWETQSEAVGDYVVNIQGTDGIMNEKGYTDVVSGVSINVAGAVALIDEAIAQAAEAKTEKPETAPAPEQQTGTEITTVEVVSGATFSSKAVIRAIDEGYAWLLEYLK
ncbi:MAG: hypothetical protein E7260_11160 [Lachnospiraceae bacterium]|nr:hypothetical protein [Lachnospiraceae bacterium]